MSCVDKANCPTWTSTSPEDGAVQVRFVEFIFVAPNANCDVYLQKCCWRSVKWCVNTNSSRLQRSSNYTFATRITT